MSKLILLALFAMVSITVILAAPMEESILREEAEGFLDQELADPEEDHPRFRRVTCDLLSFGGYAADTACAANCLSMGKAGGTCNGGVCQCRKSNIKDLWDKRFG